MVFDCDAPLQNFKNDNVSDINDSGTIHTCIQQII